MEDKRDTMSAAAWAGAELAKALEAMEAGKDPGLTRDKKKELLAVAPQLDKIWPSDNYKGGDPVRRAISAVDHHSAEALRAELCNLERRQLEAEAADEKTTSQAAPRKASTVDSSPKSVGWTKTDLQKAVREYKAKRAAQYNMLMGILNDKKSTKRQRDGARKEAKKVFGRNAIARELRAVPKMVGGTPEWEDMARGFGFTLRRGKALGTQYTVKPGKVGIDIAVEDEATRRDHDKREAEREADQEHTVVSDMLERAVEAGILPRADADKLKRQYTSGEVPARKIMESLAVLSEPLDE